MKKRSTLMLAAIGVLSTTGILLAAASSNTSSIVEQKNEEPQKKYEVFHFQNGEVVTIDTLIPMTSSYSVEDFLKDRNIQANNIEVIKIPYGAHPQEMDQEHKVMVKTRTEKLPEGAQTKEEIVEINVEDDGNGNVKATKTVNGKTVEISPEELEEIQTMHHSGDEKEIVIDLDIEKIDSMTGEISKIIKSIDLNIDDLNIDMDSLMNAVMEQVDIDVETDGKKVIVKSFVTTGDNKDGKEQVVIMHSGEDFEWNSEDGKSTVRVATTDKDEDMTIVLVTENVPPKTSSTKSSKIETLKADFTIYPNPSTGQFKLEFSQDKKAPTKIQIIDLSGRTVYSEDLGQFKGRYNNNIDLSQFGKGVYTIYIMNEDTPTTGRVIIQ